MTNTVDTFFLIIVDISLVHLIHIRLRNRQFLIQQFNVILMTFKISAHIIFPGTMKFET